MELPRAELCSGSGWQLIDGKRQRPEKRSTANALSIAVASQRAHAKSPPPNGGIGIVEIR
jgi:hypothetical protein